MKLSLDGIVDLLKPKTNSGRVRINGMEYLLHGDSDEMIRVNDQPHAVGYGVLPNVTTYRLKL